MRRRQAITGLVVAAAAGGARAQKLPRIAILHSGYPRLTPINVLYEALAGLGYSDGRSAHIELLSGEGNEGRLAAQVDRLVAEKPDVIIAVTPPAVVALKKAGIATPVVFTFVVDPVSLGIVQSLAKPGGNFTGMTFSEALLGGKRLGLLVEAVEPKRVAVLWGRFSDQMPVVENIRASAVQRGIEIFARQFRDADDLEPAFAEAAGAGSQAVIFMADNRTFGERKRVAALALAHRMPSMHSFAAEVEDGGLMFYGPSLAETYQRAAALAGRILKGTPPGNLPVEQPTRFELIINTATAKALGLTLPPSLLAQADLLLD